MRKSAVRNKVLHGLLFAFLVVAAGSSVRAGAQSGTAKPVKVSAAESEKLIDQKDHEMEGLARASHANGKATFEFTVTPEGNVTDIKTISETSDSHGVANLAVRELIRWKYHPYLVDGKPTAMRTTTSIEYHY